MAKGTFTEFVKNPIGKASLGVGYGFTRPFLNRALAPVTARIPGGFLVDNVAIFTALALTKQFVAKRNNKLLNAYLDAGMAVEAAFVGNEIFGKAMGAAGSSGNSAPSRTAPLSN